MAKVKDSPSPTPLWPWGGAALVREKLVDPTQFDKRKARKSKGDPKNPALASAALMDFIGPAHTSDELRLPQPPPPSGQDAPLFAFHDFPHLASALGRSKDDLQHLLDQVGPGRFQASRERMERLKALAERESSMLKLLRQLEGDVARVRREMDEAQKREGY